MQIRNPTESINTMSIPTIDSFRLLQELQERFCSRNKMKQTPQEICVALKGEIVECEEALSDSDTLEIQSEVADIMIFTATLANLLNINLAEVVGKKLMRNFYKYNPVDKEDLMSHGLSAKEAYKEQKRKCDKALDELFMR